MGWPLYKSSRTFVTLNLNLDWIRLGDTNKASNLIQKYAQRHNSLSSLSLFEFAKQYRYYGGTHVRRAKDAVVRVVPKYKLCINDEYDDIYYKVQVAQSRLENFS